MSTRTSQQARPVDSIASLPARLFAFVAREALSICCLTMSLGITLLGVTVLIYAIETAESLADFMAGISGMLLLWGCAGFLGYLVLQGHRTGRSDAAVTLARDTRYDHPDF